MSTGAGTSGVDAAPATRLQRYGTIVVVGGGCYGSYYVRQLGRAATAGAITWRRLLVVDREPGCAVAAGTALTAAAARHAPAPELVVSEWEAFFDTYLTAAAERAAGEQPPPDAVVPSPLMPHLLFGWLLGRARQRWPQRVVEARPLDRPPDVPWQRAAPGGTHYVSFAEWMCPVNCIEPRRCPHTRGPRSWSLPTAIEQYVARERRPGGGDRGGTALEGPLVFHCSHRAFGVGMIDTADILAADERVRALGQRGPADILVGTMSHCHGALDRLHIGP